MNDQESRVARERDLYVDALRLLDAADPTEALRSILAGLVELSRSERAYLELYQDATAGDRRWSLSHGCSSEEEEEIRAVTSRGIVAAAIASGSTLHTPFAALDARFAAAQSVQRQRLEAVLCVPLSGGLPGVLYLQGRRGAGPFAPDIISIAENLARFVGSATHRVISGSAPSGEDPTLPFREKLRVDAIAGRSQALAEVFERVALAAPLNVAVLLTGASGTGKTQLARAIHENSKRKSRPFVELNCAAIPEGLIESELFGTEPGAFPGARHLPGKVEAADGGTLFLDEIAEIPLAAQGKLLQFLQSKEYYALASTRVSKANVRVIAASNADLQQRVEEKKFREDLFYRLNVFTIRMPSLSERKADIGPLIDELVSRAATEHELPHLNASPGFYAACEAADWPGNVRQLHHQLEAALIRACAEGSSCLQPQHLSQPSRGEEADCTSFHEATRQFQRDLLRRTLYEAEWNVSDVARRLDLTRAHVYNLIKAFGLKRE